MGLITLPSTLVAHATAAAGDVMADLNAILNQVNGNLDASNLATGAVTPTKIATTPRGAVVASTQSLANNTFLFMVFTSQISTDSMVDLVAHNERVTVHTDGVYVVQGQVRYAYNADSARRLSAIAHMSSIGGAINSSHDDRVNVGNAGGGGDTNASMCLITAASAGEYFQLQAYQDSGATVSIDGRLAAARIGSL